MTVVRLSANLSLLFGSLPLEDRIAAAKAAGFRDVESWWPFAVPDPSAAEVDAFLLGLDRAGLSLRGLNFFAGDMAAGARGLVSVPGRSTELFENVPVVRRIALATGCLAFNALYGHRTKADTPEEQDAVAVRSLGRIGREFSDFGGVILLEALKAPDNGDYPLRTLEDADAVRRRVLAEEGVENIALLFDTFHLAGNGVDLESSYRKYADRIGHIQYADYPGRGTPGTGSIDFPALTRRVEESGYDGFIGCEYLVGDERVSYDDVLEAIGGDSANEKTVTESERVDK